MGGVIGGMGALANRAQPAINVAVTQSRLMKDRFIRSRRQGPDPAEKKGRVVSGKCRESTRANQGGDCGERSPQYYGKRPRADGALGRGLRHFPIFSPRSFFVAFGHRLGNFERLAPVESTAIDQPEGGQARLLDRLSGVASNQG
jgi:hypothetical protein